MDIVVHTNAPEPVYEQIVRQIHDAVKAGPLKPDTPLPTVRQLAGDLVINRNTVARAYRILEEQGVILTAGRKGTFIRQDAVREVAKVRTTRAEPLSGFSRVARILTAVVLPAPLGPSRPSTLPVRAEKSTPHRARTEPYDFSRPSTTIASLMRSRLVERPGSADKAL